MNSLISKGKIEKQKKKKKKLMITCWRSSQKHFYRFFSKNTRQEVKSLVQINYGMLNYHFVSLRVKKGPGVQVEGLVQCMHVLMSFKCHLFYMRQLVET